MANEMDVKVDPVRATDDFHRLYYESVVWTNTRWLGVRVQKCPLDLWVYQEIVAEKRPDVIVECGTRFGGSALFLATVCDCIGNGRVISIDLFDLRGVLEHPRIDFRLGDSTDERTVAGVRASIRTREAVMVVLDSDHHLPHVLREMELYGPLVSEGQYLIVEDTNINGHPVAPHFGPGPKEAVEQFLHAHREFTDDRSREKFLLTFHPGGYLLKGRT
jgi:cephalosporin hydroxylase